jgi:archaellum component FlaC
MESYFDTLNSDLNYYKQSFNEVSKKASSQREELEALKLQIEIIENVEEIDKNSHGMESPIW